MSVRSLRAFYVTAAAAVLSAALAAHLAGQNVGLTLLARDGRRTLPLTAQGDQQFVALDDLASTFQLAVHEEAGAVTVSYKGKTIVLTPDQALASVAGRLVSISASPVRQGRRWLVPLDFVSRALALIYDTRLDLRPQSRLLVVGDLRVPRVLIRYESQAASARITIDATPRATSTVSQESGHILVRFDADALDLAPFPPLAPQGLVQGFRQADPLTIAIDLTPRFGSFRSASQPIETTMRVVIDILAAQTETQAPAAPGAPGAVPPGPPPPPELPPGIAAPASAVRTIALDPGHGGEDEGAKGAAGTKEKDLTLAVARRIKATIEGRLGIRVLLTRDDDRNVPIEERSAIANNSKADLFISLHANASWRHTTAGATIYTAAFDSETAALAHTSTAPERLPAFGGGMRDIDLVPWDLAQTRFLDRSADLARMLEEQLKNHVALSPHALDRAPLRVLEAANMPAVLIEMGFLSNAGQEKQLGTPDFQAGITQAIADAVVRYRDANTAGTTAR